MMELAIHYLNIEQLRNMKVWNERAKKKVNHFTMWQKNIDVKILEKISYLEVNRVYFGNEFCERLIPKTVELLEAIKICKDKKLKLTLVTPFVSESGYKRVEKLLEDVESNDVMDEVAFNDWGILQALKADGRFKIVSGRVIEKSKRDPRIAPNEYKKIFSEHGLKMLQSPSCSSSAMQELFRDNNVKRSDIDNLPQGLYLDNIDGHEISVAVPYGFVTTGRICQFAGLSNNKSDKFRVDTKCQKECQGLTQFMEKNISPMSIEHERDRLKKISLVRKGNTVFYANSDISHLIENRYVSRVIYQPEVPM